MKHSKLLFVPAAFLAFAISSENASATCSPDPYMASVCTTAATFCPRSYMEANGQLLQISQYNALFSLIGIQYGGDGRTTFALPDYRGRSGIGEGRGTALSPVRQGNVLGRESITLTQLNLPSHTHTATVSPQAQVNVAIPLLPNSGSNTNTPSNSENYLAASPGGPASAAIWSEGGADPIATVGGISSAINAPIVVSNTGGSQPFENRPPQVVMRYCVAIEGTYPPRD